MLNVMLILVKINNSSFFSDYFFMLKSNAATASMPVLAVSANPMTEYLEKGKHAGFTDHITKPINIQNFYSALDKYLN